MVTLVQSACSAPLSKGNVKPWLTGNVRRQLNHFSVDVSVDSMAWLPVSFQGFGTDHACRDHAPQKKGNKS